MVVFANCVVQFETLPKSSKDYSFFFPSSSLNRRREDSAQIQKQPIVCFVLHWVKKMIKSENVFQKHCVRDAGFPDTGLHAGFKVCGLAKGGRAQVKVRDQPELQEMLLAYCVRFK